MGTSEEQRGIGLVFSCGHRDDTLMRTLTSMAVLTAFISGVSTTSARADSAAHVAGKGKYCKEKQLNGYLDCFFTSLDACQRRNKSTDVRCVANPNLNKGGSQE